MKRLLTCSVVVMLVAGAAKADVADLTLWLADKSDGDSYLTIVGESNTGVIQLWMEVPAEMRLVNVDAILTRYDPLDRKSWRFSVQGFNDFEIADSLLQRLTRGSVEDELPYGNIGHYQYVGEDANFPLGGDSGLLGPRTILLDEIILHCIQFSNGTPEQILFGPGTAAPGGFELVYSPTPPPGQWIIQQLAVVDLLNGTWDNPFVVETVPEPGALSLLVLAGLTVARRRGSRGR